ncbi:hypothetical protein HYC85_001426 [Camellia sinensis]|uniref:TOD1/MUCI70 glycosyltransferase-like domain-containing protein n=1 Tax=Camellia sinensis TaxID=4442 RepID=A0A7J7I6M9_CAMSI|nr:hypothetical protein HYC85_001426 [Camellia sinensis]
MTGGSLGLRTASYGSMQQPQNDVFQILNSFNVRKPSKMPLSGLREKERFLPFICRYLGRRNVGMLILVALALLAFLIGFITVNKVANSGLLTYVHDGLFSLEDASESASSYIAQTIQNMKLSMVNTVTVCGENNSQHPPTSHSSVSRVVADSAPLLGNLCKHYAIPPPPPGERKRIGPRPCPVCYLPVEQAIGRMPRSPSVSAVIHHLNYFREENPIKTEPHGRYEFGGFPSLKQRNESFNIKESMTVHCGFVKGCRPGYQTAFDIDEADLRELEQLHDVIVASAIFGNYDIMQQPTNISEVARENVPFVMFIDEETEKYMKNSSGLDSSKKVGLWRIVVVCNIPYTDPRRNGKAYHKDLLRQMASPAGAMIQAPLAGAVRHPPPPPPPPPPLVRDNMARRTTIKKNPIRRGRDRKSGSRHHRKVVIGGQDNISI